MYLSTDKIRKGIIMYCSKCGSELKEDSNFCSSCGVTQQDQISTEGENSGVNQETLSEKVGEKGKYIDEEGFIRKPRDGSGIFIWFAAGVIGKVVWALPSEYDLFALILGLFGSYFAYLGIKMYSSHDIETWKHSNHIKLWIYVGCLFVGLVGIIVYYYLKGKERKYLAKSHNKSINTS